MWLIKLNLYPLRRRSQNCSMEILSAPSTLIFNFEAPFETFHSAGLTHISKAVAYRENTSFKTPRKQQKQIVVESFLAVVGSCRGKHMVLAQLSSLLIHIRLVPIVIGCLFRVTKKLRVIIDDITLLVPSKECFM